MDAPLDEAELEESERNDKQHQHDGFSCGERIVLRFETIKIDFIDHQFGGFGRTAVGHDVNDAKRILKTVGDVDNNQEEDGR